MAQETIQTTFDTLYREEVITDLRYVVKSGKEATVFCCEPNPVYEKELVAVKIFRPREFRGFKNDNVYQSGRIKDRRMRKAFDKKSRKWHQHQEVSWLNHEYRTLTLLYEAGANVPQPIDCTHGAILMEYVGDDDSPAPQLKDVRLSLPQARTLFDLLLHNLNLCLATNRVHADLSAFNILYWQESLTIIDFPQAVDPRDNRKARALLIRDLENVCQYFERYGLRTDPQRLGHAMWREAGLL